MRMMRARTRSLWVFDRLQKKRPLGVRLPLVKLGMRRARTRSLWVFDNAAAGRLRPLAAGELQSVDAGR